MIRVPLPPDDGPSEGRDSDVRDRLGYRSQGADTARWSLITGQWALVLNLPVLSL